MVWAFGEKIHPSKIFGAFNSLMYQNISLDLLKNYPLLVENKLYLKLRKDLNFLNKICVPIRTFSKSFKIIVTFHILNIFKATVKVRTSWGKSSVNLKQCLKKKATSKTIVSIAFLVEALPNEKRSLKPNLTIWNETAKKKKEKKEK